MIIKDRNELRDIIKYERELYTKKLYPNLGEKKVKNKTVIFMKSLRCIEFYENKKKYMINYAYWKTIYKVISLITNISIPQYVFDKGLIIMHLQNIVISSKVKVGENCCLFHNTTIGISMGKEQLGFCPQIADNVTICTGACVIGGIKISSDTVIAANAVVTKTFEETNVILGGIPAKVIKLRT